MCEVEKERNTWLSPPNAPIADFRAPTVALSGSNGHTSTVSVQDSRPAIAHDDVASSVMALIDGFPSAIDKTLNAVVENTKPISCEPCSVPSYDPPTSGDKELVMHSVKIDLEHSSHFVISFISVVWPLWRKVFRL